MLLQIRNVVAGIFHALFDIGNRLFGLALLRTERTEFVFPAFEVRLQHGYFTVHAFETALQRIQLVRRLQAFVRKVP